MNPTSPFFRANPNNVAHDKLRRGGVKISVLATLVVMQAITVVFFLGDVIGELMVVGLDAHTVSEAVATMVLIVGIAIGAAEMARIIRLGKRAESALNMAAGAFAVLLKEKFELWQLTASESEVALLTLKGFDPDHIAQLRGTARGTVRAQLAGIYKKSGCGGRGQFVSLFIDALLDDPVFPGLASARPPRPAPPDKTRKSVH